MAFAYSVFLASNSSRYAWLSLNKILTPKPYQPTHNMPSFLFRRLRLGFWTCKVLVSRISVEAGVLLCKPFCLKPLPRVLPKRYGNLSKTTTHTSSSRPQDTVSVILGTPKRSTCNPAFFAGASSPGCPARA